MHTCSINSWRHDHIFLGDNHVRNERRTWLVVALTAAMMVAEIAAGAAFGSMALLADGFHMATHAGALTISALAYLYARRHAEDDRFSFGTGKLGDLAGFASAIILALIALLIGYESFLRMISPVAIRFDEAIAVAIVGLAINLACAWLLHDGGHQRHEHHHHHHHHHEKHGPVHQLDHDRRDRNLRSAYLHVLADALTSVLAIIGLVLGRAYGWVWMDPLMGIVAGLVIARWSWGLIGETAAVLLDKVPDTGFANAIRELLEQHGDRVSDVHLWRIGPGHMAAIVSLVSDRPCPPDHYKARLRALPRLSHVTVEVHPCPREPHA